MGIEKIPTEEEKIEHVRYALEKATVLHKETGRMDIFVTISNDPRGEWVAKIKVAHIIDGMVISPAGQRFQFKEIEHVFVDDQVIE